MKQSCEAFVGSQYNDCKLACWCMTRTLAYHFDGSWKAWIARTSPIDSLPLTKSFSHYFLNSCKSFTGMLNLILGVSGAFSSVAFKAVTEGCAGRSTPGCTRVVSNTFNLFLSIMLWLVIGKGMTYLSGWDRLKGYRANGRSPAFSRRASMSLMS